MISTPMADYRYIIKPRASRKIFSFYQNVAKKYRHTYDKDDLKRDVQNAVFSIFRIENGLLRREPTISQWAGYQWPIPTRLRLSEYNAKSYLSIVEREQARAKLKWYFAYTIDGDTITVVDARHAQNMRSSESSI